MKQLIAAMAIVLFMTFPAKAQEKQNEINNIKLSGLYYTGEAYASSIIEANNSALITLVNKINSRKIERGEETVTEEAIKGKVMKIEIHDEEGVRVFIYIPKKELNAIHNSVAQNYSPSISQSINPTATPQPEVSQNSGQTNMVSMSSVLSVKRKNLLSKLKDAEVFSAVEFILKQAKYEDPSFIFGRAGSVGNTDECFMIIINNKMYVEAILSAKINGVRTNINTKQQQDKGDFPNCAAIYFK